MPLSWFTQVWPFFLHLQKSAWWTAFKEFAQVHDQWAAGLLPDGRLPNLLRSRAESLFASDPVVFESWWTSWAATSASQYQPKMLGSLRQRMKPMVIQECSYGPRQMTACKIHPRVQVRSKMPDCRARVIIGRVIYVFEGPDKSGQVQRCQDAAASMRVQDSLRKIKDADEPDDRVADHRKRDDGGGTERRREMPTSKMPKCGTAINKMMVERRRRTRRSGSESAEYRSAECGTQHKKRGSVSRTHTLCSMPVAQPCT